MLLFDPLLLQLLGDAPFPHNLIEHNVLQPGEAGVKFRMGMARCKACSGFGVVACPHCGGQEVQLPPPDPDEGPLSRGEASKDEELSLNDWLARFGSSEGSSDALSDW